MHRIFLAFAALLFFSFPDAEAKIIEMPHFHDLAAHVTPDTLVIVDIDDTLLIPSQMLGCTEWYKHRKEKHQKAGLSDAKAREKSLAEWMSVRHLTRMEIVEPGSDAILRDLQKKGHRIMALTSQEIALAACTAQHLDENLIDLSVTAPHANDEYMVIQERGALYRKGILFTSGRSKGTALMQFCERIGFTPKRIVFVDDTKSHLENVEATVQAKGIEFIGLRYAYADRIAEEFDADLADFQYSNSTLTQLLSNDEARHKMKSAETVKN